MPIARPMPSSTLRSSASIVKMLMIRTTPAMMEKLPMIVRKMRIPSEACCAWSSASALTSRTSRLAAGGPGGAGRCEGRLRGRRVEEEEVQAIALARVESVRSAEVQVHRRRIELVAPEIPRPPPRVERAERPVEHRVESLDRDEGLRLVAVLVVAGPVRRRGGRGRG